VVRTIQISRAAKVAPTGLFVVFPVPQEAVGPTPTAAMVVEERHSRELQLPDKVASSMTLVEAVEAVPQALSCCAAPAKTVSCLVQRPTARRYIPSIAPPEALAFEHSIFQAVRRF
jgi:hypothetical protein